MKRYVETRRLGTTLSLMILRGSVACLMCLCLAGWNVDDEINRYFATQGLNRLAVLRDDIRPGALILAGRQGAIYAGQMLDYRSAMSSPSDGPTIASDPSTDTYHAILEQYEGHKALSADVALTFIQSVFQIEPSARFTLTGQLNCE